MATVTRRIKRNIVEFKIGARSTNQFGRAGARHKNKYTKKYSWKKFH